MRNGGGVLAAGGTDEAVDGIVLERLGSVYIGVGEEDAFGDNGVG